MRNYLSKFLKTLTAEQLPFSILLGNASNPGASDVFIFDTVTTGQLSPELLLTITECKYSDNNLTDKMQLKMDDILKKLDQLQTNLEPHLQRKKKSALASLDLQQKNISVVFAAWRKLQPALNKKLPSCKYKLMVLDREQLAQNFSPSLASLPNFLGVQSLDTEIQQEGGDMEDTQETQSITESNTAETAETASGREPEETVEMEERNLKKRGAQQMEGQSRGQRRQRKRQVRTDNNKLVFY